MRATDGSETLLKHALPVPRGSAKPMQSAADEATGAAGRAAASGLQSRAPSLPARSRARRPRRAGRGCALKGQTRSAWRSHPGACSVPCGRFVMCSRQRNQSGGMSQSFVGFHRLASVVGSCCCGALAGLLFC